MDTADIAGAYLRQESVQAQLIAAFRSHRPDEAQLARVRAIAAVALDRAGIALRAEETAEDRQFWDAAECGALFGYVLGLAAGAGAR